MNHDTASLKKTITSAIAGLVLLLTGCATTTTQVGSSAFMPDAEAMAEERGTGGLDRMSHEELLAKAGMHLRADDYQLAKLHYAMALRKNNQSAEAYAGLGTIFLAEKNLQGGREAFDQALAIEPRHQQALLAAGKIRRRQGKPLEALDLFNRALAESPEHPAILTEIAITYDSLGQEEKAEPIYLRVTELAPHAAASYNNLGYNYLLQQKYSKAVRTLERAASLNQEDRLIMNNLATAYGLSGRPEEAFQLLRRSLGEAEAHNNLGYFHMIRGERKEAEIAFNRALELNPVFYARARENLENLKKLPN